MPDLRVTAASRWSAGKVAAYTIERTDGTTSHALLFVGLDDGRIASLKIDSLEQLDTVIAELEAARREWRDGDEFPRPASIALQGRA